MRTSDTIQKDIALRFEDKTLKKTQEGSAIDMYNVAVAETLQDVYQEIEDSKKEVRNKQVFPKDGLCNIFDITCKKC